MYVFERRVSRQNFLGLFSLISAAACGREETGPGKKADRPGRLREWWERTARYRLFAAVRSPSETRRISTAPGSCGRLISTASRDARHSAAHSPRVGKMLTNLNDLR